MLLAINFECRGTSKKKMEAIWTTSFKIRVHIEVRKHVL